MDPVSDAPDAQTDATRRFNADVEAVARLADTERLGAIDSTALDAAFYPGGHGPLWDLVEDDDSIALIEAMIAAGKPVAAVCHSPAVFRHTRAPDGTSLVDGKAITGFSNAEEAAVGLTSVVPFLVEDMLKSKGGIYRSTADWGVNVVTDGMLVTGQNPASSGSAASALLSLLDRR
jgi:putative intracellular protease/amidase